MGGFNEVELTRIVVRALVAGYFSEPESALHGSGSFSGSLRGRSSPGTHGSAHFDDWPLATERAILLSNAVGVS